MAFKFKGSHATKEDASLKKSQNLEFSVEKGASTRYGDCGATKEKVDPVARQEKPPKNNRQGSGPKSKDLSTASKKAAKNGAGRDGKANQLRNALLMSKVLLPRPPQRQQASPEKHISKGTGSGDCSITINKDLDSIFNTVQAKSAVAK